MSIKDKVPVTILTGFLGSGKTTLLNRILSEEHGKRIAVIENEYGEVGIDQGLVINADEEVFEMSNGCICCTVRGDLIRVLGNLMKRRDKFDYVLVDCPAGVEDGFKNALAACKEAIVVTNPELSAVRDADRVIGILNTSDIEPIQLVINRVRPNMMANQEMLSIDDVQGILSLPLLGIVLEDEQVIISTNRGEPLTLTDGKSPAKKCYLNVSQRLTGKDVPIIDPKNEGKSLKDKFMRLMQTKVF